jgi:hypothetical protein
MKNKVLMGLAAIAMVAFLSSCGKYPQTEVDSTNAAIAAAQAAEANVYVPVEFAQLQDSMNVVLANAEAQRSKLIKNFGSVKEELTKTSALANQVTTNAGVKKEEVRKEAETLLNDTKNVIAENGKLIPKLPRGKEGAAVIEQMKADLTTLDASVTDAQGMFEKGAFMDALNKVKAANDKAVSLNKEIKEVLTKARIKF